MTTEEQNLLSHALGASSTSSPLGWRNYFAATPGDQEDLLWGKMVEKGWARLHIQNISPCNIYLVTDTGITELKAVLHN